MKSRKFYGYSFSQIAKIIICILAFAFLIGVRDEFSQIWIRTLLAGVAGGIFGLMMIQCRKPPPK